MDPQIIEPLDPIKLVDEDNHAPRQNICQESSAGRAQVASAPAVVLLDVWAQASQSQISRYTSGYKTLYPSAEIVLLRDKEQFPQAYDATLETLLNAQSNAGPRRDILLHLFGTSGAAAACDMLQDYRLHTGRALDVGALIADVEPYPAMASFLGLRDISAVVSTVLLTIWLAVQQCLWFWTADHTDRIHRVLNDPLLLPLSARKCFILANPGLMLSWAQRDDSAADDGVANCIQRSSVDKKSRWSVDQERYWSGIEDVWTSR